MAPKAQPVESASMPQVPAGVQALVKMLDEPLAPGQPDMLGTRFSYDDIFNRLTSTHLMSDAGFHPVDIDSLDFRRIFSQISPVLLRSLLLNTVGYDFWSLTFQPQNFTQIYSDDQLSGAYVASFHLGDRKGKFLTKNETLRLITILRTYASAAENYATWLTDNDMNDTTTAAEIAIIDEAMEIDGIDIEEEDYNAPKWATPRTVDRIYHLVAMFEDRCKAAAVGEENEPQMQAPLMIGNTDTFYKRFSQHRGGKKGQTPDTWGLIMACIGHMGLQIQSVCVPIVIAEKEIDVNNGEILGTILAGSKLPGRGLNVKRPGTHNATIDFSDEYLNRARDHINVHGPWYVQNLQRRVLGLPLSNPPPPVDPALQKRLEDANRELKAAQDCLEHELSRLKVTVARAHEAMDEIEAEVIETQENLDLLEYLDALDS